MTTILCLASYEKGAEFIREAKARGAYTLLLTVDSLQHAAWPREAIDELYVMPDLANLPNVINGVSYLARSHAIDRIVALDDYDVEMAAALREHLRLPGTGSSAAKIVRDKLAMRFRARQFGVPVPPFSPTFPYESLRSYITRVPGPWLLKPRSEVSTIGIRRIEQPDDLWPTLDELGDRQSYYLLERYIPGDVFHIDSLVWDGQIVFAEAHQYARPPLDVFHGGGVASSRTVERETELHRALLEINADTILALGIRRGPVHAEFIRDVDGHLYFLELGARVGGAHTAEMVEAATGVNLWREWARIEMAGERGYTPPVPRLDYGAVLVSLARQEHPDTGPYDDLEIVWRLDKPHHVGLVLASPDYQRIETLLSEYRERFAQDFAASAPAYSERPPT